ncbi:hypothetical protein LWI28_028465 [Acer negundo]|uniref:Uncharacterized protein n=1 Tax=Acer negundo TaxID=4023 RepID=A0AAD5J1V4_ACENE|nr:hypothetical protein LWI28_028465 [Acer negundo]
MAHNRISNMLFDDDSDDEFQLLAITVIKEEKEMVNECRTLRRRGSIPGHAVIQHDRFADNFLIVSLLFRSCSLVGRRTVDGQIFFATLNKNLLALGLGFMNKEKILITTFT